MAAEQRDYGELFRPRFGLLLIMIALAFLTPISERIRESATDFHVYYWRVRWSLSAFEKDWLKRMEATRLYVRFFDWSRGRPLAPLEEFKSAPPLPVTPVVFIENSEWRNNQPKKTAENILAEVNRIAQIAGIHFDELQIDCDWTPGSKAFYFEFLQTLRKLLGTGIQLSVTLRLHQIKFMEESGVPPAAGVSLMLYNMNSPSFEFSQNSIYDDRTVRKYLSRIRQYPLKMSVILPIFSWALHLRDNHVEQIIPDFSDEELSSSPFVRVGDGMFEARHPFFMRGFYFQAGDRLKSERVSSDLLQQARRTLQEFTGRSMIHHLGLFSLSEQNLKHYDLATLRSLAL